MSVSAEAKRAGPDPVAILPYGSKFGLRLAYVPLDALLWPTGGPAALAGRCIGDLPANAHVICFPSSALVFLPRFGVKARISIMIVEPKSVHARYFQWLRLAHRRFHRILTRDRPFLSTIPNGLFFNFVLGWVREANEGGVEKTINLSIIASARAHLEGHKLRHRVVSWLKAEQIDADVLGRGYRPFENKADGLAPYRYSIVIENSRESGYFTEKLLDAFMCRTVPIYWGASDVAGQFDGSGMLICETFEDIKAAVRQIGDQDYNERAAAIERNRALAMGLGHPYLRAAELLNAAASVK